MIINFLYPFILLGQLFFLHSGQNHVLCNESELNPIPRSKYKHVENAPIVLECSTGRTFQLYGTGYRNAEPLSNNGRVHWRCILSSNGLHPDVEGAERYYCDEIKILKYYLFFEQEVYIFWVEENKGQQGPEISSFPEFVAIKYFNEKTGKKGYLRSSGFMRYEDVD